MHGALWLPAAVFLAQAASAPSSAAATRAQALYAALQLTVLILLVFVVGAIVMIRLGRMVLGRRRPPPPTEYVDAWAQARVTDEQIRAATQESGDDAEPPDAPRR